MKTEDFLSQLLGVTETKVSNHNMNPIGFVHYNKPDQINKPVADLVVRMTTYLKVKLKL